MKAVILAAGKSTRRAFYKNPRKKYAEEGMKPSEIRP
jgi:choline kinase